MTRNRDSVRARRICFNTHKWLGPLSRWFLTCHVCKRPMDAARDSEQWRADHIRRWAEDGDDTPENLIPICVDCDAIKAPNDTRDIAHAKRAGDRHHGIKLKGRGFGRGRW